MYDAARHFSHLYETAESRFGFQGSTKEEWGAWSTAFRPELRRALGIDVLESSLAGHRPRAVQSDLVDLGDYTREQWHIWVEPTVPLPFYLLRPKGIAGPLPLVLTPHGHNHPHIYAGIAQNGEEARSMAEGERDIAVQAVRQGYVAIAPTTRGFGETRTEEDIVIEALSSCRTQLLHGLLVGRTPIGERVWDISRLIDWATESLELDPGRIAITGNSGGGTVSLFAAACDTRISVAVPSSYFCTFAGSIGSIYHCACNYVPGMLRLGEMYDVAGLIAPRAFCAVAGRDDPIFPIEHTRRAFRELRRIYEAAGVPEACALFVGEGGHRFYSAGAWPFVRRHFAAIAAAEGQTAAG